MSYIIEERKHEGLTIQIHPDEDPMDPRDWDNLGRMFCFHRNYILGDKHDLSNDHFSDYSWGEIREWASEEYGATVVLPLYLLDHSGLSMSTSDYNDSWDSGCVGFICDTLETREMMGIELDRFGRDGDAKDLIRDILKGEIDTYDRYLRGDICGYVILDEDDHELDACWGFFGEDDAIGEAETAAEWHAHRVAKEQGEANARAIARTATLAWNGEDIDVPA